MDAMNWSVGSLDAYGQGADLRRQEPPPLARSVRGAEPRSQSRGRSGGAYRRYQATLRSNRAFDFDDLLMQTVVKLREDEALLASFRHKFRHVLVDEYQDTNHAQYSSSSCLPKSTARSPWSVTTTSRSTAGGARTSATPVVRGRLPRAVSIRLEQNYRSTARILDAAHAIVERDRERKPKKLWTEREAGEPLIVHGAADAESEADWVTRTIQTLQREGRSASDVAVLYRTNSQSRALEEGMRRRGLPYVIVGGTRFYERQEVKDAVAYLRILANPADDWSMTRVLGVPKRGIGPVTIKALEDVAHERGVGLSEALVDATLVLQVNAPTLSGLRELAASSTSSGHGGRGARRRLGHGVFREGGARRVLPRAQGTKAGGPARELYELVAGVQTSARSGGVPPAKGPGRVPRGGEPADRSRHCRTRRRCGHAHDAAQRQGLEFPVVFLADARRSCSRFPVRSSRRVSTRRSGGCSTSGLPGRRTAST